MIRGAGRVRQIGAVLRPSLGAFRTQSIRPYSDGNNNSTGYNIYDYYDLGLANFKLKKKRAKEESKRLEAEGKKPRWEAKTMVFDTTKGTKPPSFDEVFGGKNNSSKSSRRDVSYRDVYKMIGGVKVPKRPIEPDNCCMSGCINCVWDLFAEDIDEWKLVTQEATAALEKKNAGKPEDQWELWPSGFDPPPKNLDEKYIPAELQGKKGKHVVKNRIPVGLEVFQQFEKKKKLAKLQKTQSEELIKLEKLEKLDEMERQHA